MCTATSGHANGCAPVAVDARWVARGGARAAELNERHDDRERRERRAPPGGTPRRGRWVIAACVRMVEPTDGAGELVISRGDRDGQGPEVQAGLSMRRGSRNRAEPCAGPACRQRSPTREQDELARQRQAVGGHRHEDELEPERAEGGCREHVARGRERRRPSSARPTLLAARGGATRGEEREHATDEEERRVPLAAAQEADVRRAGARRPRQGSGSAMKPQEVSGDGSKVVDEQREEVAHRRREEQQRRQRCRDACGEERSRASACGSARANQPTARIGIHVLSRVNASSAITAIQSGSQPKPAVEREDRGGERRRSRAPVPSCR